MQAHFYAVSRVGRKCVRHRFVLSISLVIALATPANASAIDINGDLKFIKQQALKTLGSITPGNYPSAGGQTGAWTTVNTSQNDRAINWVAGFFPGELWLLYQATGSTQLLNDAEAWTDPLASQATRTDTHDVGFIIGESFGNGYRLTGNPIYKNEILAAGKSLATMYSSTVGAVRSWSLPPTWSNPSLFPVIIDNMMTLGPLQWGATNGDPIWGVYASTHAETTAAQLVTTVAQPGRPVGATYQLANFNPTTGAPASPEYYQTGGLSPTSVWSRGQAWGLYGFVQAYQATGNPTFLATAKKIANYFFSNLPPDYVPYWDFDAKATSTTTPPRDTSAAAIAADGLIMLSTVAGASLKGVYLAEAEDILGSLSTSYLDRGSNDPAHNGLAVLIDGSDNVPDNREVNTALIWGDYFFTEALLRLQNELEGRPPWTLYDRSDPSVPEPSIWAMMLIGFAGLGLAGYRASRKGAAFAG
jgi:unsaturated chondroitin disaccharide hydrolase